MQTITPEDVYLEIKAMTPQDIDTKVLNVLMQHVGRENSISRRHLIDQVFGVCLPVNVNLANLRADRQVRLAIARLQKDYPIIGSSGGAGYCMVSGMDELTRYEAEINSRAKKLLEKSRRLRRAAERLYSGQPSLGL